MLAVVFVAFDLGAIRGLFGVRDTFAELVGVGALPMANVLALAAILGASRPKFPTFLTGFVVFGAAAMLACLAWAWQSPDSLTMLLLRLLAPVTKALRAASGGPLNYAIASVLLGAPQAIFAVLGGTLASLLTSFARRRRLRSELV